MKQSIVDILQFALSFKVTYKTQCPLKCATCILHVSRDTYVIYVDGLSSVLYGIHTCNTCI